MNRPEPGQGGTGRSLCLFDLDHTLLPLDSDHAWGEFTVRLGWVDPEVFREANHRFYAQYLAGALDIEAYIAFATEALRRHTPGECDAAHARFMREVITPAISPQAIALVREHQAAGDWVALVTATNDFVTGPIAAAFGIDALIAVQLERGADGRPSGRIRGVPSYREGKPLRVGEWLDSRGARWSDFERITVYSDSPNDLPLLELASVPVATNPSPALAELAAQRGWRILNLFP